MKGFVGEMPQMTNYLVPSISEGKCFSINPHNKIGFSHQIRRPSKQVSPLETFCALFHSEFHNMRLHTEKQAKCFSK